MSRPYDNRPVGRPRGPAHPADLDSLRCLAALAPGSRLARLIDDHDTSPAPEPA